MLSVVDDLACEELRKQHAKKTTSVFLIPFVRRICGQFFDLALQSGKSDVNLAARVAWQGVFAAKKTALSAT